MANEGWGNIASEATAEATAEAGAAETQEQFIARRDAEILEWRGLKEQSSFYVNAEREARAKVTATLFPAARKGTQRYELGAGYKVKLVYGFNYKLGNKELVDPATNELTPINKQGKVVEDPIGEIGNEGPFLAERLIRWKPELVEKEYLALDPEIPAHVEVKALIDAILTITPATPTLELEEPKAAK